MSYTDHNNHKTSIFYPFSLTLQSHNWPYYPLSVHLKIGTKLSVYSLDRWWRSCPKFRYTGCVRGATLLAVLVASTIHGPFASPPLKDILLRRASGGKGVEWGLPCRKERSLLSFLSLLVVVLVVGCSCCRLSWGSLEWLDDWMGTRSNAYASTFCASLYTQA